MILPYDIARCKGIDGHEQCSDCRRKEPGDKLRQVFIVPQVNVQVFKSDCWEYIEPEQTEVE